MTVRTERGLYLEQWIAIRANGNCPSQRALRRSLDVGEDLLPSLELKVIPVSQDHESVYIYYILLCRTVIDLGL